MEHIREAVKEHPQLEKLLKPQFEDEVWEKMMVYGEGSRFFPGVSSVLVYFEAEDEKPLKFEREIKTDENNRIELVTYTVKNK